MQLRRFVRQAHRINSSENNQTMVQIEQMPERSPTDGGKNTMTYKLNPIIEKCTSPVKIIFNGTTGNSEASLRKTAEVQTWEFENGAAACKTVFEMKLNVLKFYVEKEKAVFEMYEFLEPAAR